MFWAGLSVLPLKGIQLSSAKMKILRLLLFPCRAQEKDWAEPPEDRAEPLEDRAEPLEDRADPLEDRADPLEDRAEALEDRPEPREDSAEPLEDSTEPQEDRAESLEDRSETKELSVEAANSLEQVRGKFFIPVFRSLISYKWIRTLPKSEYGSGSRSSLFFIFITLPEIFKHFFLQR